MVLECQFEDLGEVIAALVKQGLTFKAQVMDGYVHITLTGGY